MRHIDFLLRKHGITYLDCELSVKIHTWLLAQLDDEYAQSLHTSDDLRPFSLFTRVQQDNIALRLSLLHEAAAPLLSAVYSAYAIEISGINGRLEITDHIEKPMVTVSRLNKPAPNSFQIIFASPASYRRHRQVSNLFSLPPLLYTAAAKLRQFEGVDIPNEDICEICDYVSYLRYELRTAEYKIKPGIARPGFEGEVVLRLGGNEAQRNKLALLIRYAAYAGLGAKTALGMGGILLAEK